MNATLLCASLALIACVAPAHADSSTVFRQIKWGMTRSEVITHESATPIDYGDKRLMYDARVGGHEVVIQYNLELDTLMSIVVHFMDKHSTGAAYIERYQDIGRKLLDKYGPATVDTMIWRETTYEGHPEYLGKALTRGHLRYAAGWFDGDGRTDLYFTLDGDNDEIEFRLKYVDRARFAYRAEARNRDGDF